MNGEKIWESLQEVDPEWIDDAAKYPRRKPVRMTMRRAISLAACLAVMLTSGGLLLFADFSGGEQTNVAGSTTASMVSSSFSAIQIVLIVVCFASIIGILMIMTAFVRGEKEERENTVQSSGGETPNE